MDEIIAEFRNIIYKPKGYIRRPLLYVLSSPEWSKDDLINELVVRLLECPDSIVKDRCYDSYRFCFNIVRGIYRRLLSRPEESFGDKIESIYCSNGNGATLSNSNTKLIKQINKMEVLDDTDRRVLEGFIDRREASEDLGISKCAYQKRLYRKYIKIREILDN